MISFVGVSHRTAPIEVRERLSVTDEAQPALLRRLRARFRAGAIVATCHRLELYLPGEHEREEMVAFLVEEGGLDGELAGRHLRHCRDAEAVSHLYAVAAGIDSMVLGEAEILGQVRTAFSASVAAGADDAVLSRLFHTAIRVGRRARAETRIGQHALSVSSIAAQQARALYPEIERATVLVIGAGEAGRVAAEALVDRGVGRVRVASRTPEHARRLAEDLGGETAPFDRLVDALAGSDVVIAASGSPDHLVALEQMVEAMARRDGQPLVAIDIGLPRDFDPAVRDLPGVVYRDLDDLQVVAAEHFQAREAEVASVREIVEAEASRFVAWWEQLRVVPTISALTERAEQLRRVEVAKSVSQLALSEGQTGQLEAMTKALVKQILHDPIVTLRERGDRDLYVDAVRTLFHLDEPLHDVNEVDQQGENGAQPGPQPPPQPPPADGV